MHDVGLFETPRPPDEHCLTVARSTRTSAEILARYPRDGFAADALAHVARQAEHNPAVDSRAWLRCSR